MSSPSVTAVWASRLILPRVPCHVCLLALAVAVVPAGELSPVTPSDWLAPDLRCPFWAGYSLKCANMAHNDIFALPVLLQLVC